MIETHTPGRGLAAYEPESTPAATAIFVLNSSESKRLIARGVAALPPVRQALLKGWVVISRGTTNALVAEEILGTRVSRYNYSAGIICGGELTVVPRDRRMMPYVLHDGQLEEMTGEQAVENFGAGDVFVKGANAVDPEGNAGVFMASDTGGTIGGALGTLVARGSRLIVPVGLEKLIPSVTEAARKCGIGRYKYALGQRVGLMPLVTATVVTEIQALAVLTGVRATHVGSGGIGGSEGAVTLTVEGTDEQVDRAWALVQSIKGEPAVGRE